MARLGAVVVDWKYTLNEDEAEQEREVFVLTIYFNLRQDDVKTIEHVDMRRNGLYIVLAIYYFIDPTLLRRNHVKTTERIGM